MSSQPRSRARRRMIGVAVIVAFVLAAHFAIVFFIEDLAGYHSVVAFRDGTLAAERAGPAPDRHGPQSLEQRLEPISPFEEIAPFDDDAKAWSSPFNHHSAGVVVFDANGDGRLDVYFAQNGANWTRPTDERGVLQGAPRPTHGVLYLNSGTGPDGRPIYQSFLELAAANDTYVEEELLIEEYLVPRKSLSDPAAAPGRRSVVAVAADFNGDGRPDLLVGNALPGGQWATPENSQVVQTFINPIGRSVQKTKRYQLGLMNYFVKDYRAADETNEARTTARGEEAIGANSLYINLGDRDGDGLPEWRDVSRASGIEGKRNTFSFSVADIDLDGDLDVYEGNIMDLDFWPGGAKGWAGGANQLYVNQLVETGKLEFVERSVDMGVDGVFTEAHPIPDFYKLWRIPLLPEIYSLILFRLIPYKPEPLTMKGQTGEQGEISWATLFQDVNDDGYPDLWVANDLTLLRLYLNEGGKRFVPAEHGRSTKKGNWMSFAPADFNRDLSEDLFVGNYGGATYSASFIELPAMDDLFDPPLLDGFYYMDFNFARSETKHALLDGRDFQGRLAHRVQHSRVLPPDASLPNNVNQGLQVRDYDPDSLDAYEFSWGSVAFDVQNDGRMDLYSAGAVLSRGGALLAGAGGTSPGRLTVNATQEGGEVELVDLTAEHHVFDIEELQYDKLESEGYIWRKAPLQNWGKRDTVKSFDYSVWIQQGASFIGKVRNNDMLQCAENARAVLASDLDGDGFVDLLIRNDGGYDSRSSKSKNLQIERDGVVWAVPSPDPNYHSLTNFEPGSTRVFMNTYAKGEWLKVVLLDDTPDSKNRDAIGAKVVVNGRYLRIMRATSGSYISNSLEPLSFGLGTERATELVVRWPDAGRTEQKIALPGYSRGTVVITKSAGVTDWRPREVP